MCDPEPLEGNMSGVVYNGCYGGFSLSAEAVRLGKQRAPDDPFWKNVCEKYGFFDGPRHDPVLVSVVRELGRRASGSCANLCVEDLPSGALYRIDEYDGNESVTVHDVAEYKVVP